MKKTLCLLAFVITLSAAAEQSRTQAVYLPGSYVWIPTVYSSAWEAQQAMQRASLDSGAANVAAIAATTSSGQTRFIILHRQFVDAWMAYSEEFWFGWGTNLPAMASDAASHARGGVVVLYDGQVFEWWAK